MKLLFFRADWCSPCRQMAPIVETIMLEDWFKDRYSLEQIDIDTNPDTATKWGVRALPTFVIVDDRGTEVARHIGFLPTSKMREWMSDNYQRPSMTVSRDADHSLLSIKEKPTMLTTIKRMLGLTQDSPVIGSIELWAGNHVPKCFAPCSGQQMSIRGNEPLFSVIGTTYGGDGRDFFNLPDYRPRDSKGVPQQYDVSKSPMVLICIQGMYPSWDW